MPEPPASSLSETSRLAALCLSPFHACTCASSALPLPWLTLSPYEDNRLKTSFLCLSLPHLGPARSSASPPRVRILGCPPEPSSRRLPARLPPTAMLLRFWGLIPYCQATVNPAVPPEASGCMFFPGGFSCCLHPCAHMGLMCCSCSALSQHGFGLPSWDRGQAQPLRHLGQTPGCRATPRTSTSCQLSGG